MAADGPEEHSVEKRAEIFRERLRDYLETELVSAIELTALAPLAGGASRAAFAFDIKVEGGPHVGSYAAVLRLDLGGEIYAWALSRRQEFEILRAARAARVPVPEPYWESSDEAILGRDFFVMQRVEGETIGAKIVRRSDLAAARDVLPAQMGEAIARIHGMEFEAFEFLSRPDDAGDQRGHAAATWVLRRTREELDRIGSVSPSIEAICSWLEKNAPTSAELVLTHGDFRLGNMIVAADGLKAVIDWEFACVSDPHEDLSWPFVRDWRFGRDELRFAGISHGEDFLRAYEAASGRSVDRRCLRYWEILGNLRWAVGCLTQAHRHLSGRERSVELASLGRRSVEMQLEAMLLIEAFENDFA